MPGGRPSDFTQEIANKICEQLSEGQSLRSICLPEDMPARSTIFLWLANNKTFSDQYAHAREEQADTLFDEVVAIADEAGNEDVQQARLRIDARKWVAGKLRPKKYGEKIQQEVSGADGAPLQVNIVRFSDSSE